MAERGKQSSIQDGSDADIAFTCTPCNELGSREEAVKYCPECDEFLCTTCTKYHLKMKATRDHKLVDREEGKHESKTAKATLRIKCQQHPDRDIEMYCGTHDMVYCLMCIATEHRTCSDVTSLTDAAGLKFQQNEITRMQKESESIKELLKDTEKKKQQNVTLVEEKKKQNSNQNTRNRREYDKTHQKSF
ncbi:E3 ubiquitin-protein ligase TRIM33-like [Mercenaria mercenaria]|uniref:E3 ubiquitin-protein ligase TRIM33-like n=1 Tax=Mercenaria mercenaria TaxID=6596 RepID=UPI00234E760E|nr:E3 ubiquitin-protein ligase TRIM33-like [Mercenaria mercenaria]XP_045205213.2 E3 ubiquitin-protein ligase TRIM33-like [Mercenaria mercenaria]XP_045205214.2 E3 ubiquitin-protein ligase TRIM33-like [Mercenaria mercenaria]